MNALKVNQNFSAEVVLMSLMSLCHIICIALLLTQGMYVPVGIFQPKQINILNVQKLHTLKSSIINIIRRILWKREPRFSLIWAVILHMVWEQ